MLQPWTTGNKTWQALNPFQRAAAMALMEAPASRPGDVRNVLGAMINRAGADPDRLGMQVSSKAYQPTIEPGQQARLGDILDSDAFQELVAWAQRRTQGLEPDPVGGATHFLAPEKTMVALTAENPKKYRSWPQWTGYDPATGSYQNVTLRDKSHAFINPEGENMQVSQPNLANLALSSPAMPGVSLTQAQAAQPQQQSLAAMLSNLATSLQGGTAPGSENTALGGFASALQGSRDAPPPLPEPMQLMAPPQRAVDLSRLAAIVANRQKLGV